MRAGPLGGRQVYWAVRPVHPLRCGKALHRKLRVGRELQSWGCSRFRSSRPARCWIPTPLNSNQSQSWYWIADRAHS